ncbi:MAG TPA: sigma factor-like helix-turn-helix DNA-binding protein [Humisphaera sp.]|nr:sigma factor-like helix-turn-helix DNA-binding protein [Humisphaera sp.]
MRALEAPVRARTPGFEDALDDLAPEHKSILLLRECLRLDYDQIAQRLGITRAAVADRLSAARRDLLRARDSG